MCNTFLPTSRFPEDIRRRNLILSQCTSLVGGAMSQASAPTSTTDGPHATRHRITFSVVHFSLAHFRMKRKIMTGSVGTSPALGLSAIGLDEVARALCNGFRRWTPLRHFLPTFTVPALSRWPCHGKGQERSSRRTAEMSTGRALKENNFGPCLL